MKGRFSGRIGLKVLKDGNPYLVMSSHVITEAITARSFPLARWPHTERLADGWNVHAEIWGGNEKVSSKNNYTNRGPDLL